MQEWEFYKGLEDFLGSHQSMRRGQAAFNFACSVNEKAANSFLNTEFDPFYDSKRIPEFVRVFLERVNSGS